MKFDCQNPTHISPSLAWKLTLFLSHPPAMSNRSESIQPISVFYVSFFFRRAFRACSTSVRGPHIPPPPPPLSTKAFFIYFRVSNVLLLQWQPVGYCCSSSQAAPTTKTILCSQFLDISSKIHKIGPVFNIAFLSS
jgi:hypothetical protein